MLRFGRSKLTVQYFSSWEHLELVGRKRRMFEVFHYLIERLLNFKNQPINTVQQYCLGSSKNELEGRLMFCCNRYRESGIPFWNLTLIKCFEVPSEFVDEDLDGLYQTISETVLPFRLFHKQSLSRKFQLLYQAQLNVRFRDHSTMNIALQMTNQVESLLALHFKSFVWTFDELYDQVSLLWKCKILSQGCLVTRSNWIRPYWTTLQRILGDTWEDFKNLRSKSFEFSNTENQACDFIEYTIDNFLPVHGVGQTFEFKPWKNWSFTTCSIAFFCKQRTRVQWGVHPFLSCLDEHRSEEEMQWFGSDCLTVRFVFQQPGGRPCDTVIYDAECCVSHLMISDKDCRSSLLWLFGHAVEHCLMRQIENIVFDELSNYGYISPFSYMERLDCMYQALQLPDAEIFPMCFPLFEIPHDRF